MVQDQRQADKNQIMLYTALKFRINSLCKRSLKIWRNALNFKNGLKKLSQSVNEAQYGYAFFCLKNYTEDEQDVSLVNDEQSENLHIQYQADKLKQKMVKIFKKKHLF